MVLILWYCLLWVNTTHASVRNSLKFPVESISIYKDSITTKKSDTTNNQKPANRSLSGAEVNPLMARWKKEKSPLTPKGGSALNRENSTVITRKFKSFPQLDKYTKNLYLPPNDGLAEFTPDYVKGLFKVDNKTQEVLDAGKEVFEIIERNQRFINIIGGQELVELPVGIKQNISDNSYITLGIVSMEYHPNYTVVDMFAEVVLNELNVKLLFGANDVKISREGGIYDEARLNLLADFPVGQNGGQWLITFKGGKGEQGTGDGQTYITINCEGKIKEMAFNADVRIAKTVALPLNENGSLKYPGKTAPGTGENPAGNDSYVGASFEVKAAGLDDLLIALDLPYFELKALPNWGFKMQQTVLDLSDTKNAEGIIFPDLYRNQGLLQGGENLWRGFHAKEVRVTLPPEFKKKGSEQRISIGAQNLFIDNFGVSGDFYATNILDINEGDASKWQFSVDSIAVDLKVNRFIKAGFKGEIILPISENDASGKGQLGYTGIISTDQFYSVQVDINDEVDFSIFKAKGKLAQGSYIKMEVENGRFYPEANLTGQMAFSAKQMEQLNGTDDDGVELEFEGLSFENFKIQTRERPYLSIGRAGFKDDITLPKLAGFELGFYDVEITTDQNDNATLALNCFVNLDDSGIHGDVGLNITGELQEGDLLRWRYKGLEVTDIEVDVKRKSFEFYGKLTFFKDNPIYGKGFAGDVQLYAEDLGLEVGARGLFGAVDDYRYWFVDGHGRPTRNSNPNFTIFDIGGGVYHHMRKAGMNEQATSLSGINYQPDKTTSLGFKALAAFEVQKGASFTGLVGIEMSFNAERNGGGVSRVGFYGAAALLQGKSEGGNPRAPFGTVDEMQAVVAFKEQSLANSHELSLDREGINYFATEVFPNILTGNELFAAQVGIDLDFRNRTYWGLFDVFLNAGAIKGEGEKNRLGYLEFYNSPEDWYIYVGTPTKRFGLRDIPVGPFKARFNLYFMTGTILPDPAKPPQNVIDILDLKGDELIFGRNFDQQLARGAGYAFGAKFELGMGFDWGLVYADVSAGAGFDLMLRDFGDAQCQGREGTLGMDGWYAVGQMYAYLQGKIGVQVNLAFAKVRVPILSGGLAVLAQAQIPNPVFIKGYAGIDVRVLGTIRVRTRLKIIIGEECEMINNNGVQDFVMISDITPRDGFQDVDVFDAIQVAFNVPVGDEIQVEEEEGRKTYRVNFNEFILSSDGKPIEGEIEFNSEKDLLTFKSFEILPAEKEINVLVSVTFEEKAGANWVVVSDGDRPVAEKKEIAFTTSKAPRKIPLHNIKYMYPVVDQSYMFPEESNSGFVQLDTGQDYLFGNGYSDELYFIDEMGVKSKVDFSYDASAKRLNFSLPELRPQTKYTYALITLNPTDVEEDQVMTAVEFNKISEDLEISNNSITGSASNGAFISRLDFNFQTSKHNTFKEKMKSLKIIQSVTTSDIIADTGEYPANVGRINLIMDDYEPFGINDIKGTIYTNNQPLIKFEALLNDDYYKNDIYPLVYENYPLDGNIRVSRNSEILGLPPVRSLQLSTSYISYL